MLLTEARWEHIVDEHPELAGRDVEVLGTVPTPDAITPGTFGDRWCYWAAGLGVSKWMFVVVDWRLPSEPYIVTAFSKRKGPTWQRHSN